ncbi:MAG: L-threonylcarbamoyladenylate synthase [Planctomycetota bacterium]
MATQIRTDVNEAARLLEAGELVAIPTETVYGLAANAFDANACLRIFEVKQRPAFDPLIVHVADAERLGALVTGVSPEASALVRAFWPGPLTLVLPKRAAVPDVVTSGLDTVAVRQPAHPLARRLLERLAFPLAAPSANLFGRVSPTRAAHVVEQLDGRVPYVLDGGPCEVGVESTIVGWEEGRCVVYRPGGVPLEALEAVIGPLSAARACVQPASPGLLAAHYAPRTGLVLGDLDALLEEHAGRRVALLTFREPRAAERCLVLAPDGDLARAARRLFSALRELDACGADLLLAEPVPDIGLGRAINDRLRRAAAARA